MAAFSSILIEVKGLLFWSSHINTLNSDLLARRAASIYNATRDARAHRITHFNSRLV